MHVSSTAHLRGTVFSLLCWNDFLPINQFFAKVYSVLPSHFSFNCTHGRVHISVTKFNKGPLIPSSCLSCYQCFLCFSHRQDKISCIEISILNIMKNQRSWQEGPNMQLSCFSALVSHRLSRSDNVVFWIIPVLYRALPCRANFSLGKKQTWVEVNHFFINFSPV